MGYQTLAEKNQFKFKCPIFGAETKMSSCIKLRDMVWKGQKPEQRKGCQVCMHSGKCPAAQIAQRMAMSGARAGVSDDYGSATPVLGKLRKDVLEHILPVMVMPSTLLRYALSSAEVSAIETANERIRAMLGSAPGATAKKVAIKGNTRKAKKLDDVNSETKPKVESKIEQAAKTGDLSAAL